MPSYFPPDARRPCGGTRPRPPMTRRTRRTTPGTSSGPWGSITPATRERTRSCSQEIFRWRIHHPYFSVHHFLRLFQKRAGGYNAFEKDFAIINIFFGDSTAFGMMNCILCLSKEILYRIWEKGEDDGDRLHFFARRTVWSVPWIQSHVLRGDHLLVLCRNGAKDAVQKMRNILTFLLHLGHWLNECVSLGYRKMFFYPFLRGAVNNFRFIFFGHF